jgi:hypothetical protein
MFLEDGAGDEIRTRDINLGKVALYQLSYSRLPGTSTFSPEARDGVKPGIQNTHERLCSREFPSRNSDAKTVHNRV